MIFPLLPQMPVSKLAGGNRSQEGGWYAYGQLDTHRDHCLVETLLFEYHAVSDVPCIFLS